MKKWLYLMIAPLLACCLISSNRTGPKYCVDASNAMEAMGRELAKEHQLEFLNDGVGTLADAHQATWAVGFVSRQQLTLEQARPLATRLASQLVRGLFTNPAFTTYCQKDRKKPLHAERVAFRLAFWDRNENRPKEPFLAQIRLADGNLYYHYADPKTQALLEPIVEPFNPPAM